MGLMWIITNVQSSSTTHTSLSTGERNVMADYHWDGPLDAHRAGTNQLDASLKCPSQAFWKPRVTRCKYSHLSEAPAAESGPTGSNTRWHNTVERPGGKKKIDSLPSPPGKQRSKIPIYVYTRFAWSLRAGLCPWCNKKSLWWCLRF